MTNRWFALLASGALITCTSFVGCGGSDSSSGGGGKSGSGGTGATGGGAGASGAAGTDGGNAVCGNSVVEDGEECDDGNTVQDDGCDNACQFNCIAGNAPRDKCDDGNACNGTETCGANHACASGTPLGDGDACGTGMVCLSGNCVSASCGDAQVQSGEECDDGNSTPGDGCENDCKFSCVSTDATRDCSTLGGDECAGASTCNDTTHMCASTPLADGASCNGGAGTCKSGVCIAKTCGNGTVDPGEQCEPPNTATCDANCQTIAAAVCGDGTIQAGEDCDDKNTKNLDGCDSNCKYEFFMRMDTATIERGTAPGFCSVTKNQLGAAITSTAQGQLNTSLQDGINAGTTNVLVQALDLDDLTGVADPSLRLGVTTGSLDPAHTGTWPATGNPMDWWYLLDATTLDANGVPTGILTPASIAARALNAGPNDVNITLLLSGSPATLQMLQSKVKGRIDTTTSVPAPPPSALAAGLKVAEGISANGAAEGLCGNITVDSLSKIPIPQALTSGAGACGNCNGSKQYTYCGAGNPVSASCNSLLDALVGGCKVVACFVPAITATQPDVGTGGAAPKTLTLGAGNKVTNAAGNTDAYSAWLRFHGKRAHATGSK